MYYSLDNFIRENDTDNKVKKAIADCITENITKEIAIDTLAHDLQKRLYDFINSEDLWIDDGSNVQRDFTKTIINILTEYFGH